MPNHPLPPYPGNDWREWAIRLVEFIGRPQPRTTEVLPSTPMLAHQLPTTLQRATENGVMMYNPGQGVPVFSRDRSWHQVGTMVWRGSYDPNTTYHEGDVVLDQNWLAIANKDTDERPAPVEIGFTEWQVPDAPTWTTVPDVASIVFVGIAYECAAPQKLSSVRFWGRPGYVYDVFLIPKWEGSIDTTRTDLLRANVTPAIEGWYTVSLPTEIYDTGEVFGAVVSITVDPAVTVPSVFAGNWNYILTSNANPPGVATIVHNKATPQTLMIHKTDADGADRASDLATVGGGTQIALGGAVWTVVSKIDNGSYITCTISPAARNDASGLFAVTFTVPAVGTLSHKRVTDYFAGSATTKGFKAVGSATSPTLSDHAFGIDLELTPVAYSGDWDLLAYSGATGSADATKLSALEARVKALENG